MAVRLSPTVMERTAGRMLGFIHIFKKEKEKSGYSEVVCAASSVPAAQTVPCGGSQTGGKESEQ